MKKCCASYDIDIEDVTDERYGTVDIHAEGTIRGIKDTMEGVPTGFELTSFTLEKFEVTAYNDDGDEIPVPYSEVSRIKKDNMDLIEDTAVDKTDLENDIGEQPDKEDA